MIDNSTISAILYLLGRYPKKEGKMNLFAVRLFKNNKWHIIRTYGDYRTALEFADFLTADWDIKEMSVEEIIKSEMAVI